jgi:hypothetical protein
LTAYRIVGHAPKQTSIEQNFPQVRVSSLRGIFVQKCRWIFHLRLRPANALAGGTLLAIG